MKASQHDVVKDQVCHACRQHPSVYLGETPHGSWLMGFGTDLIWSRHDDSIATMTLSTSDVDAAIQQGMSQAGTFLSDLTR